MFRIEGCNILIRVRIRGLAATALSKLLFDKGYSIVQASDIIRNRFGLKEDYSPADVTVKDSDEDEILVIGFYDKALRVYEDIVNELEYVFKWYSNIGLYSIHIGVVVDKNNSDCIVDLGSTKGVLNNCKHDIGDKIVVSVVKTSLKPREVTRLSYSLRIVGEYVALIHGSSQITFSEHIRDKSRRDYLLTIAVSKLIGTGLGIHFRSSSMYAGEQEILNEIDNLRDKLVKILGEAKYREKAPRELYSGEFIGLIGLTSLAKSRLDSLRNNVVTTIPLHHSFKTIGGVYSELVDLIEKMISSISLNKDLIERSIVEFLYEKLFQNKRIRLIHIKPDGSRLELTPGIIHSIERNNLDLRICLTRTIRSNGLYDGLNIEKKEGDIDFVFLETNNWFISHNYFRKNEWIGSYININTPPEILPDTIKYHDLMVDIVVKPGEKPELVDTESFNKYCSEGIISEKTCKTALDKINEIINNTNKYIYTEFENKQ
ncbi:MAG: DUF402 domain-containing protein [Desulfurococcaceae archaeon]